MAGLGGQRCVSDAVVGTPVCCSSTPPSQGSVGSRSSQMGVPTPSTSQSAVQHTRSPVPGITHELAGSDTLQCGTEPKNCTTSPYRYRLV